MYVTVHIYTRQSDERMKAREETNANHSVTNIKRERHQLLGLINRTNLAQRSLKTYMTIKSPQHRTKRRSTCNNGNYKVNRTATVLQNNIELRVSVRPVPHVAVREIKYRTTEIPIGQNMERMSLIRISLSTISSSPAHLHTRTS